MENGSKRPDRPALAHATVRAAVAAAIRLAPGLALFAGGKSFGARMTSQADAEAPLAQVRGQVRGLIFLGFPLHPAGKPADDRAKHLAQVAVPMLFLQGTRDALANPALLARTLEPLAPAATLRLFDHADHSFHVPKRSGRTDTELLHAVLDTAVSWMAARRD